LNYGLYLIEGKAKEFEVLKEQINEKIYEKDNQGEVIADLKARLQEMKELADYNSDVA